MAIPAKETKSENLSTGVSLNINICLFNRASFAVFRLFNVFFGRYSSEIFDVVHFRAVFIRIISGINLQIFLRGQKTYV
jgi:hypothetical protein